MSPPGEEIGGSLVMRVPPLPLASFIFLSVISWSLQPEGKEQGGSDLGRILVRCTQCSWVLSALCEWAGNHICPRVQASVHGQTDKHLEASAGGSAPPQASAPTSGGTDPRHREAGIKGHSSHLLLPYFHGIFPKPSSTCKTEVY